VVAAASAGAAANSVASAGHALALSAAAAQSAQGRRVLRAEERKRAANFEQEKRELAQFLSQASDQAVLAAQAQAQLASMMLAADSPQQQQLLHEAAAAAGLAGGIPELLQAHAAAAASAASAAAAAAADSAAMAVAADAGPEDSTASSPAPPAAAAVVSSSSSRPAVPSSPKRRMLSFAPGVHQGNGSTRTKSRSPNRTAAAAADRKVLSGHQVSGSSNSVRAQDASTTAAKRSLPAPKASMASILTGASDAALAAQAALAAAAAQKAAEASAAAAKAKAMSATQGYTAGGPLRPGFHVPYSPDKKPAPTSAIASSSPSRLPSHHSQQLVCTLTLQSKQALDKERRARALFERVTGGFAIEPAAAMQSVAAATTGGGVAKGKNGAAASAANADNSGKFGFGLDLSVEELSRNVLQEQRLIRGLAGGSGWNEHYQQQQQHQQQVLQPALQHPPNSGGGDLRGTPPASIAGKASGAGTGALQTHQSSMGPALASGGDSSIHGGSVALGTVDESSATSSQRDDANIDDAEAQKRREAREAARKEKEREAALAAGEYTPLSPELVAALVKATKRGDATMIQTLLEQCPPNQRVDFVNHKDKNGSTAIFHTVWPGHLHALRALLLAGADPNTQNVKKNTALHLAVERGHLSLIRCLLEFKADPTLRNFEDKLCFHTPAKEEDRLAMERFIANTAAEVKRGKMSSFKIDLTPLPPEQNPFDKTFYAKRVIPPTGAWDENKVAQVDSEQIKQLLRWEAPPPPAGAASVAGALTARATTPAATAVRAHLAASRPGTSVSSSFVQPAVSPGTATGAPVPTSAVVSATGGAGAAPWFDAFASRQLRRAQQRGATARAMASLGDEERARRRWARKQRRMRRKAEREAALKAARERGELLPEGKEKAKQSQPSKGSSAPLSHSPGAAYVHGEFGPSRLSQVAESELAGTDSGSGSDDDDDDNKDAAAEDEHLAAQAAAAENSGPLLEQVEPQPQQQHKRSSSRSRPLSSRRHHSELMANSSEATATFAFLSAGGASTAATATVSAAPPSETLTANAITALTRSVQTGLELVLSTRKHGTRGGSFHAEMAMAAAAADRNQVLTPSLQYYPAPPPLQVIAAPAADSLERSWGRPMLDPVLHATFVPPLSASMLPDPSDPAAGAAVAGAIPESGSAPRSVLAPPWSFSDDGGVSARHAVALKQTKPNVPRPRLDAQDLELLWKSPEDNPDYDDDGSGGLVEAHRAVQPSVFPVGFPYASSDKVRPVVSLLTAPSLLARAERMGILKPGTADALPGSPTAAAKRTARGGRGRSLSPQRCKSARAASSSPSPSAEPKQSLLVSELTAARRAEADAEREARTLQREQEKALLRAHLAEGVRYASGKKFSSSASLPLEQRMEEEKTQPSHDSSAVVKGSVQWHAMKFAAAAGATAAPGSASARSSLQAQSRPATQSGALTARLSAVTPLQPHAHASSASSRSTASIARRASAGANLTPASTADQAPLYSSFRGLQSAPSSQQSGSGGGGTFTVAKRPPRAWAVPVFDGAGAGGGGGGGAAVVALVQATTPAMRAPIPPSATVIQEGKDFQFAALPHTPVSTVASAAPVQSIHQQPHAVTSHSTTHSTFAAETVTTGTVTTSMHPSRADTRASMHMRPSPPLPSASSTKRKASRSAGQQAIERRFHVSRASMAAAMAAAAEERRAAVAAVTSSGAGSATRQQQQQPEFVRRGVAPPTQPHTQHGRPGTSWLSHPSQFAPSSSPLLHPNALEDALFLHPSAMQMQLPQGIRPSTGY
jgi:hypothetical protein